MPTPRFIPGGPNPGRLAARPIRWLPLAFLLLGTACLNLEEQRDAADDQVYALVASRRAQLGATSEPLVVEPPASRARDLRAKLVAQEVAELTELDLVDCLELAAESNRDYQTSRERLYLTALDLTLERFRLGWRPFAGGSTTVLGDLNDASSSTSDFSAGFTRVLGSGAQVVADIGSGLFESLLSSDGDGLTTNFSLAITQPLLAGAGRLVTLEPLRQAERDLVYEVRTFERFRRTLAFDVATRYYRILQAEENLSNEIANQESLTRAAQRNEALAEAGRLRDIQLDQARQDVLRANSRVISATQSLQDQIDGFALFLGLPVGTRLELDEGELQRLVDLGVEDSSFDEQLALDLALERRLDLQNARDRLVDARRQVEIAANALESILDFSAEIGGESALAKPLDYTRSDIDWSVGFGLDLPVGRLPERNLWRATQIAVQAAERSTEQLEDSIRISIRDALRELRARQQDYRIQDDAVVLSERRVESVQLFLEAGEAQTRDLLEAQDALVSAQNARVAALVDYRLGLLALWRDTELLRVDASGLGRFDEDTDRL